MPTLKDQFYEIAGCHNRVTLPAGCIKEMLKMKPLTKLSPKELESQQNKLISVLEGIENAGLAADEKVLELKSYIYKTASPETSFEVTAESHDLKKYTIF